MIESSSKMDRVVRPRGLARRVQLGLVVGALVVAALVIALAVPAARRWARAEASVPAASVRTAPVTVGDIVRDAPAQGRVVAARHPTLYAPAAGLVNLLVRAGATVKKGDPLVRIDSPELKSRLKQETATHEVLKSAAGRQSIAARAIDLKMAQDVALLEVKLTAARRVAERAQRTFDESMMTKTDYEKTKDDVRIAELELTHARENSKLSKDIAVADLRDKGLQAERQAAVVDELQRLVDGLTVPAPFDGIVATIAVADRDAVQASAPLLTVVDLSENEIEISLADGYASDVATGTVAEVLHEGKTAMGHVTTISPEVKEGQVRGIVAFEGSSPPGLKQGQRVSVRLVFETKTGVLKLPRGPFVESGGGRVAYVIESGVATKRAIVLGVVGIGDVEVVQGLSRGETVIVSDTTPFASASTVLVQGGS